MQISEPQAENFELKQKSRPRFGDAYAVSVERYLTDRRSIRTKVMSFFSSDYSTEAIEWLIKRAFAKNDSHGKRESTSINLCSDTSCMLPGITRVIG
ncbi:hypothetical protein CDAR_127381 [Caerostris darwini]|uniref:Uncharacterized protein n=1 Tax=Caerostris darwini TaxID=1538125 RepID=A0AAV4SHN9_9ARAC|nr:hypothetical protein CDAR_127381 [Caerostris darwini]